MISTIFIFDLLQTRSVNAGLRLGGLVLKELGVVNRLHSRQLQQANFVVLRAPHIPSVLIETDYLSNPSRAQRLLDTELSRVVCPACHAGSDGFFQ